CDPLITLVQRNASTDDQQSRYHVDQAESKIMLINGTPGLKNFEATVNGMKFKVTGLKNGEQRLLDVSSAMLPGAGNQVTVTGHGRKGSGANVVISDGSVQ